MNQTVIEANVSKSKSFPIPELSGNLSATQADLITEDLGTFLVAHHILITGVDSVSAIKAYFKRTPGMEDLVDDLLLQLENAELISVNGDQLTVHQRFIDVGSSVESLQRFLPRLFKVTTDRVLTGMARGESIAKKEGVRYFVFPDDRETSLEALALCAEFRTKLANLEKKAESRGRMADGVRLVGFLNCVLNPEDFQ